jgi:hypothetical protein
MNAQIKLVTVKKPKRRGRPSTGVKAPWKALGLSKATYYRRIRSL